MILARTKEAVHHVVNGDHLAEVLEAEEDAEDGEVAGVQEEARHGPDHDRDRLRGNTRLGFKASI